jgi:hypothetical protein
VAALLEVSEKTARRHWQIAKIRLFQLRAPPETCCGNGAQRKFPLARR